MIVFNTLAKAQHYIKHLEAKKSKDPWYDYSDEHFCYYTIKKRHVLCISGWRCGCGCDRGSTDAKIIGKIKSIPNEDN